MGNSTCSQDFVDVWETSQTLQEVADRLGVTKRAATLKASLMRAQGKEVKRFREKDLPMKKLRKDLTGLRFGLLVVIQRMPNQGDNVMYECQCDCGRQTVAVGYHIRKGFTQSCGCMRQRTGTTNPNWKGHGEIPHQYWTGILIGAEKRKLTVAITLKEIWDLFLQQGQKCALSGTPLVFAGHKSGKEQTASLDRIDSTKGYVTGNIQWIHKDLQRMKWAYPQEHFLSWVRVIAQHQGF